MAKKKVGDLRLLKDGRVFGPTDREEIERLLAAGRLALTDHVSVGNADWITIAEYLTDAASLPAPPVPAPASTTSPPVSRPRLRKGDLRVLSSGRIVSSLARSDVERLHQEGRVGDDDLVCALNGPWMPLRDFLAPPLPEPSLAPSERVVAAAGMDLGSDVIVEVEEEPSPVLVPVPVVPPRPVRPPPSVPSPSVPSPSVPSPSVPSPSVPSPSAWNPPLIDPVVLAQPAAPPQGASYRLSGIRPPAPPSRDEWYVRVRGIHSAPLRKSHVKALYQAREITLDSVARHPTWHENDWRPLHSIPQLADIFRA